MLREHFGVVDGERIARDRLYTLKQYKSVVNYIQQFEDLVVQILEITEKEMLHKFIFGLKPNVRDLVCISNLESLTDAMRKAVAVDEVHFTHYSTYGNKHVRIGRDMHYMPKYVNR